MSSKTMNIMKRLRRNQAMFTFYNKEMICIGPFDWNAQVPKIQTNFSFSYQNVIIILIHLIGWIKK